jgi:hypothetical protein
MSTPFVTALVVGNCMADLCLVGSVALVCGVRSVKKFTDAVLTVEELPPTRFSVGSGELADLLTSLN